MLLCYLVLRDSKMEKPERKMNGYHQEGHESEWNGGEGCSGSEEVTIS